MCRLFSHPPSHHHPTTTILTPSLAYNLPPTLAENLHPLLPLQQQRLFQRAYAVIFIFLTSPPTATHLIQSIPHHTAHQTNVTAFSDSEMTTKLRRQQIYVLIKCTRNPTHSTRCTDSKLYLEKGNRGVVVGLLLHDTCY